MNKMREENSNGDYLSSAMSVVPKHCYRDHKCSPNMKCINILGLRVVLFVQLPKLTLNLLVGAPQTLKGQIEFNISSIYCVLSFI